MDEEFYDEDFCNTDNDSLVLLVKRYEESVRRQIGDNKDPNYKNIENESEYDDSVIEIESDDEIFDI